MSCGQPYKLKHNTSVYRSQAHDKIEHCEHIVIGGRDSIPTDGQHLGVALLLTPQANSLICAKIDIYEGQSGNSSIISSISAYLILRYESSTLILYKELSSSIFHL